MNGFGQMKDGRGNIAPVTIILPTIAMESVELADNFTEEYQNEHPNLEVEFFLQRLDEAIHDAKDILIERYQYICSQSPDSAKFMYENGTMRGYVPEEGIRSALKHGTLAIGQIGLAETLQILIGCNQLNPKGLELGQKIEKLLLENFDKQTLMSKLGNEYYSRFNLTDVTTAYEQGSFFSTDSSSGISNPVSGATYSANAACNAVNCVIEYLTGGNA